MPLTADANRDRMVVRRAERPDPPAKTGQAVVPWATRHHSVRQTRDAVEAWRPVRYLAEIARVATARDAPASIVLWKASQLGFSQLVALLYSWALLERDARVLLVMPTDLEARKYHRDLIAPLYNRSALLRQLKASTMDRQAVKGIHRVFDTGASARTQGGGTSDRYRSAAVELQILDELDAYPADLDEGDPFSLSQRAVQNTGGLLLAGSTPTSARGESQVVAAWQQADLKFIYAVRCPVCSEYDVLVWERIVFAPSGSVAERAASAVHACGRCGAEWPYGRLSRAIERGRWQEASYDGKAPFPEPAWDGRHIKAGQLRDARGAKVGEWPRHLGFTLHGFYSVWASWEVHVARWLRAQGNASRLRAFHEQVLARPFAPEGAEAEIAPTDVQRIPLAELPDDHRLCVCAVDVQDGWLSVALIVFGPAGRGVLAERTEHNGDVDRIDGSAWLAFRRWLRTANVARRPVAAVVVDTGFQSDATIRNLRRLQHPRVYAIKGAAGWDRPTYRRSKTIVAGIAQRLFILGVDSLKLTVQQRFRRGVLRLADHLGEDVAREIAGERLKLVVRQGRRHRRWVQDAEHVEALDCCVYALAAVEIANLGDPSALPLGESAPRERRRPVAERLAATGHRMVRR